MAVVEITSVSLSDPLPEPLAGFDVDIPHRGDTTGIYAFYLQGWVLARNSQVTAVRIVNEGRLIRTIPIGVPRPDVIKAYPQAADHEICGFWGMVGVVGIAPDAELKLEALVQGRGQPIPFAAIRLRHQPARSSFQPTLQPLIVTSLGRTGTTWLMRLLAGHPKIVTYRAHPYEMRPAKYWMHLLKVLAEPANHLESAHWGNFSGNFWWAGHHPFYTTPVTDHPELRQWFGKEYVEQLTSFSQQSIEAFYTRLAAAQGQGQPRYFAEKAYPDHVPWLLWELYPGMREIILVRDFRDMVASIYAMNAKRGSADFGRSEAASDAEYIRTLAGHARRLFESWSRRSSAAHLVRYEDLILEPTRTLRGLLEYLSLDTSTASIEELLENARPDTAELQQHRTAPDVEASIGRWRRDLDPVAQPICQEAFGDVLEKLGYSSAESHVFS